MFSSKRHSLYVFSPPVRPELLPMGLHGGSETAKALDSSSTVDPVSISGRLVKPSSFVSSSGDKQQTPSSAMPTSGPASERREVGANALSGHRLPGKETRFFAGQGISVRDQEIAGSVGCSGRSTRRRSARNEGGVAARPAVGVISNSTVRTSLPQTVSMGGNQGGTTWETADELDSCNRGHDKTSDVVDDPICPGDRSRVLSSSSSGDSLHGRLAEGLGHSVSRSVVERSLATLGSAYYLTRAPDRVDSSATAIVQVTKQATSVSD